MNALKPLSQDANLCIPEKCYDWFKNLNLINVDSETQINLGQQKQPKTRQVLWCQYN